MEKYMLENPELVDFDWGDSVFMKSDTEKKTEMTVSGFSVLNNQDCAHVNWIDANRQMQEYTIPVVCLVKKGS
jgi:hypothetical protein